MPASPCRNGFMESFDSKLRDEILDLEEFLSVPQARALAAFWKEEYNFPTWTIVYNYILR